MHDRKRYDGYLSHQDRGCLARFTSCCVSLQGNLALIRIQDSARVEPLLWQTGLGATPISVRAIDVALTSDIPTRLQVECRPAIKGSLHFTLWGNGSPRMLAILIPDIRGHRGLEALGWFAQQHELSPTAYIASVGEMRRADIALPFLLTVFHPARFLGTSQLEAHWQLLEAMAGTSALQLTPRQKDDDCSIPGACRPYTNGRCVANTKCS